MDPIEHLILHIGVQKTGSSLIQRSMRSARKRVRSAGVGYVDRRAFLGMPDRRAWAAYGRETFSKESFRGQLAEAVRVEMGKTTGSGVRILISNESISGRLQPDYQSPFWGQAEASVRELIDVLSPRTTSLILYVRRQDRLLESLYLQRIHTGHTTTWEEFRDLACRDLRVCYTRLIESLESVPGVGDIQVRPFEIIAGGGHPFVADFLEMAGLEGIRVPEADIPSNQSYTAPAWEAAMVMNQYVESPKQAKTVRRFLSKLFPAGEYPKPVLLSDEERRELLEMYREDNRDLFTRYLPQFPPDSYSTEELPYEVTEFLVPVEPDPPAPGPKTATSQRKRSRAGEIERVRAIAQPSEVLNRRSEEHWTGRYMRRISPFVTLRAVKLGLSPNRITALMIAIGLVGAGMAALSGLWPALVAAVMIQFYLLLDCVDGEVARYTRRTSPKGVYLDRLGHYLVESSLLIALGLRVAGGESSWVIIGLVAALLVMVEKVETDLVSVARLGSGLGKEKADAFEPRRAGVAKLRARAQTVPLHLVTHAAESSLLIALAAVADQFGDGPGVSRGLLILMVAVTAVMVVVHLFSIWQSSRFDV
jgi:phosphatidylglycerophosphate synthase